MYRQMKQYGRDATVVRRSADATFNLPLRANDWKAGDKVFVCSWSDFSHPAADEWRSDSWDIMRTRNDVTYQILTKRPERLAQCLPPDWGDGWDNVWLGVSAENQEMLDLRWPLLKRIPAKVRFLSIEPMLGAVSLSGIFGLKPGNQWRDCLCDEIDPSDRPCLVCDGRRLLGESSGLHWVIAGGESGPNARPMHPDWARGARDECAVAQVPFFFKQWGEWAPLPIRLPDPKIYSATHGHGNRGYNMAIAALSKEFNASAIVAAHPGGSIGAITFDVDLLGRVGKHRAGAFLDGREHKEFPHA